MTLTQRSWARQWIRQRVQTPERKAVLTAYVSQTLKATAERIRQEMSDDPWIAVHDFLDEF